MKSKTSLIKLNIKKEIVSPNECYFLLLFNKIIQTMISDNLEDVRGWSQGQEAVSDQSILNSLLRRKITVDNLPRLNKGVAKSCSPKLFAQTRASCLHKPSNPQRNTPTKTFKNKGKYSQRSNQSIDAKYPLKQKLLEILDEEDENILSPTQSAKKIQTVPQQAASFFPPHSSHSQSKLTHHQKMQPHGNRNKTIYEKRQQKKLTSIFKRYDIGNRIKPPSLVSKLESKTYQLKLNTIDQCPKTKRFFESFGQDYVDHYEDSLLTVEQASKRQKKLSTKFERIQRASQRMKQTFVKQDIIDRFKKRKEKVEKLQEPAQFNDQQIFNINSTHKLPPACPSQPKTLKVLKLSTLKTTIRYKLMLY